MKKLMVVAVSTLFLTACGGGKEGVAACEKVTNDLMAALDKAGNPALTDPMKKQLEAAKAEWAKVSDQTALAKQCNDMAAQMKPMLDALPKK